MRARDSKKVTYAPIVANRGFVRERKENSLH